MSKREWDNYIDKQGPLPSGFRMDYVDLLTISGKLLQKKMITQKEYNDILRDVISREAGDTSVVVKPPNVGAPLPSDFADRAELPARHFPGSSNAKPVPTGEEFAAQIEERLKKLETGEKDTSHMTGPELAKYIENRLSKIKNIDEIQVDGAKFAKHMEDRLERVSKVQEAAEVLSAVEKKYKEVMSELIGQLLQLKDEGAILTKSQEETIIRFARHGFGKPSKYQGSGKYKDQLRAFLRASPAYNNPATRDEAQRSYDIYLQQLNLAGPSSYGFFKKTNADTKDDVLRRFRDVLARIPYIQTLRENRPPPPVPPRRAAPPPPPQRAPREDNERYNTPAENLAEIQAFFTGIENKATALAAIRRITPLMPLIRFQIQEGQIDITPFKKQAKKALLNLHPDRGGDTEIFQELSKILGEVEGLNLYGNAKPRKCRKCHGYKY